MLLAATCCPAIGFAQEWTKPGWVITDTAQLNDLRRKVNGEDSAELNKTAPNAQAVTRICDYFLSVILNTEERTKEVDRFLSTLNRANNTTQGRQQVLELVANRIPAMLNHPDPNVRYNMVSLLAQGSVKPSVPGTPQKAVPLNSAQRVFLPIIADQAQNLDVRLVAIRGIERILRDGENAPSSNEKSDIADVLIKALQENPPAAEDGRMWFRRSLIHALGYVDRIDNTSGQPVVLETLLNILHDPAEALSNRAWAAKALSQLPWSAQTNAPLINHEICRLLLQMAEAYQRGRDQSTTRDDAVREPFSLVYLSYRPEGQAEASKNWGLLYQLNRAGMSSHSDLIKGSFKIVVPIVRPFLESSPKFTAADVDALRKWVNENAPQDRRVTPSSAPLP